MILVDTSVWIDHLRAGVAELSRALHASLVLCHPWVIGEIALGHLDARARVLGLLGGLPAARTATEPEVLAMIERHGLQGSGIGYLDAQLLAATMLTQGARLWTRDRRLAAVASRLALTWPGGAPR
jgi:predicted nucleic acid-binding protein